MNVVGNDMSKGKSIVTILRPYSKVDYGLHVLPHTSVEINLFIRESKTLKEKSKIIKNQYFNGCQRQTHCLCHQAKAH